MLFGIIDILCREDDCIGPANPVKLVEAFGNGTDRNAA
jgi:hypothetical protein